MSPRRKRALKGVALVFAALVLLPLGYGLIALARAAPLEDGVDLAGGAIRVIKDGFVAVSVIDLGDSKVALIYCGGEAEGEAILGELGRRGLGADAVRAIFITHGHKDHIAACGRFPKAEIFALGPDVDLIEGRRAAGSLFGKIAGPNPAGVRVTRVIDPGEMVLGERTITVYAIPGHTMGSAAYFTEGVLFLGDSAGSLRSGELSWTPWVFSDDNERLERSLRELVASLALKHVEWVVPSHTAKVKGIEPLTRLLN